MVGKKKRLGNFALWGDFGALFLHLDMSERGAGPQVLEEYCGSVSRVSLECLDRSYALVMLRFQQPTWPLSE
jgi:hypothetical protein